MKKKLLSILLSLVLTVGLLPTTALAETTGGAATGYKVQVVLDTGSMSRAPTVNGASNGALLQENLTGAMTPVVIMTKDGYGFLDDYAVEPVNGITVRRDNADQITVSGTPTADTVINLTAATPARTVRLDHLDDSLNVVLKLNGTAVTTLPYNTSAKAYKGKVKDAGYYDVCVDGEKTMELDLRNNTYQGFALQVPCTTFAYAYNVARDPAYPGANASITLSTFSNPITPGSYPNTLAKAGSWKLSKVAKYSVSDSWSENLTGIVNGLATAYGLTEAQKKEIIIYRLENGNAFIDGVVLSVDTTNKQVLFIGANQGGGSGYLLSMSEVTGTSATVTSRASLLTAIPSLSASSATHSHKVCNGSTSCASCAHTAQTWTKWTDDDALPTDAGYYYLDKDVTLSSSWTPANGTFLCLNGKTLTLGGSINVSSSNTLTITDCATTKGKIVRASENTTNALIRMNGGALHTFGVIIDGNQVECLDTSAAALNVDGGTVTMTDSTIKNCYKKNQGTSQYGSGGAIYLHVSASTTTLTNCTIQSNRSRNYGGAIYVGEYTTLTMTGGALKDIKTLLDDATYGGGAIYNKGTTTLNGVAVTDNTSGGMGGAIYNCSNAALSITGGSISGNTTTKKDSDNNYYGHGVFHSSAEGDDATLTIGAGANISDQIYLDAENGTKDVTIAAVLTHDLFLVCAGAAEGRVVAVGTTSYTLTDTDMNHITVTGWHLKLDSNQIKLTRTASDDAYLSVKLESTDDDLTVKLEKQGDTTKIGLNYDPASGGYVGNVKPGTYNVYVGDSTTPTQTITVTTSATSFALSHSADTAAAPTITTQPQSTIDYITTENANALTVAASVSDDGTLSYQWYSNTTNSTTGGTKLEGKTSTSYTPDISAAGTTYYYCVVTNSKGTATNTATSLIAEISVRAANADDTTVTIVDGTGHEFAAPKVGDTLKANVAGAPRNVTLTYQWYSVVGSTESAISGATAQTYTLKAAEQGKRVGVKVCGKDLTTPLCTAELSSAVAQAETLSFTNAYDMQRSPSYPTSGEKVELSLFKKPLNPANTRYDSERGSWTLTPVGTFGSYDGKTDNTYDGKLQGIVGNIKEEYGFANANDVPIHALTNGSGVIYGVIQARGNVYGNKDLTGTPTDTNGVLFVGATNTAGGYTGGTGYFLTTENGLTTVVTEPSTTAKRWMQVTRDASGATASTFTVSFDRNCTDSSVTNPTSKTTDTSGKITLPTLARTGYTFGGWYTTQGCTGSAVTNDAIYTANTTLYAKWTAADYTITYVMNGGTNHDDNPETYTVESGAITLKNPSRKGYTFLGWSGTGLTGTTKDVTIAAGSTGERTFTAHWLRHDASLPLNDVDVNNRTPNGSISADRDEAREGSIVTITVTPDDGFVLDELTVTDSKGRPLPITAVGGNRYTFVMPAGGVEIHATFTDGSDTGFVDVSADKYFYDAVMWAVRNGITGGVDATHFAPYASCTRGQLVTFLWRAAGEPKAKNAENPFTDVKAGTAFYQAILWAAENEVVNGYADGTFKPNAPITRQQAAAILWRFAKAQEVDVSVGEDTNILSYADAFDVAEYAIPAMQWAVGAEVLQGNGDQLLPHGTCTRAQMVTFLYRFLAE